MKFNSYYSEGNQHVSSLTNVSTGIVRVDIFKVLGLNLSAVRQGYLIEIGQKTLDKSLDHFTIYTNIK